MLTGQVWHGLELLGPEVGDLDGLVLHPLALSSEPLLVGVGHDLGQVVRVDRVQDVEEIVSRRPFPFRIGVGEELHHVRVLLELRVERLDRQLIVVGHFDLDLLLLQEQALPAREHGLEEVLVDRLLVWEVVLEAIFNGYRSSEFCHLQLLEVMRHVGHLLLIEIGEEVLLAFELVGELLRVHLAEGALF